MADIITRENDSEYLLPSMSRTARACGEIMRSAYCKADGAAKPGSDADGTISSVTKTGFRDLVTEYDTKIQQYAVSALTDAFPGAHFICEEGDPANPSAEGLTFIIDPIDGTANFTHHYGHSCTSIACTKNGKPVAGVIYDPFKDELFTALRGGGAHLNGRTIHVFEGGLAESLVVFGTAPYNLGLMDNTLGAVRSIFGRCQDIRRTGSAALDLCYTAAGRVGLYFEFELSVWDYAAGALIVEEAGGMCRTIDGGELSYDGSRKSSIIAGSRERIDESGIIQLGREMREEQL
jgi:myo-inositol-1(or 4)-monophosphatase